MTTISIKELRMKLAEIADRVQQGENFTVIRRSKPSFTITQIDNVGDEHQWETIVDFTEGGTTDGAPIEDVIKAFKAMK
jgi:antitoxin (DNA-binding transcriptional repressor) of toxin-antitoxin stability system